MIERKRILFDYLEQADRVKLVTYIAEDGTALEETARRMGFEGVVGKRAESKYESGIRGRNWVKAKAVNEQEFVVGGYTPGEGSRGKTFGSLAVGYYESSPDGDATTLIHVANVGSGLTDAALASIMKQLHELDAPESPFANKVEGKVFWTRPELVAQVKFLEWTGDNHLRAPVFLGLRNDVDPRQVRKEAALPGDVAVDVIEDTPRQAVAAAPGVAADARLVLDQLDAATKKDLVIEVEGEHVKVTNLDKPFWPPYGDRPALTKGDLVRYYATVAPWMLPHLKDRPLTLTRYPNGIAGQLFYQKHYAQPIPVLRRHDPHLVQRQPGERHLPDVQQPAHADLAGTDRRPRDPRLDVSRRPGAGCSRPQGQR